MKLNFYMEIAGFILSLFLSIATCARYHIIDLKDRLFVRMARILTVFSGMNIISYIIIRNNIYGLELIAQIGIYMSLWLLVWFLFYVNLYISETLNQTNHISASSYILYGLPSFLNLIILGSNLGKNGVFELTKVDSNLTVVFNHLYFVPYLLAGISLVTGMVLTMVQRRKEIKQKEQTIFYYFPVIFLFAYYIQFKYKAVATYGFSCAFILILIYLYSYHFNTRRDHLTHLANEHSFKKMIEYRVGNGQQMYVVMLNICDFKYLNKIYGYKKGDLFIKRVGEYLADVFSASCVARYNGDQFGIVIDNVDKEKFQSCIRNVYDRFEEKWVINKIEQKLSVTMVAVECPNMCNQVDEMEQILSYLLKEAKKKKVNECLVYNNEYKGLLERNQKIVSILKDVINNGNMFVVYQPIFDSSKNRYTRAEALFRLKDPVLHDISPAEFFPIAEEYGYVMDIGYVLLDKVCQYIKSFIAKGQEAPIISVNFSRQQLMTGDVGQKMMEILKKYDLSPEHIAIEVPESVFSVRYEKVKKQVMGLYELGFRFYLDGFGTGFLDLSHLMELPFDLIKIDKNMIREAENNDTIFLLVSAMTAVFEENGKKIVGDGIESEHLKETTDMLFMDYMQGYYFSAPVSEEDARILFEQEDIYKDRISVMEEVICDNVDEDAIQKILKSIQEVDKDGI